MAMACSRTSQCRLYIPSIPLSSGHSQCKRLFHQTSHLQGISAAGLAKQAAAKERARERQRLRAELAKTGGKRPPQQRKEKRGRIEPVVHEPRNANAKLVVTPDLELRHLLYAERHVGEVVAFPETVAARLESLGMFNEKQGFQFMRKPVSVIRHHTGLVGRELLAPDVANLGTKDRRVIVTGKGGTGKSFILLQMAAMALMQKYVVVAVPRGMDLVDNRTAYQLDEATGRFKQTEYISKMLMRTREACFPFIQDEITHARIRIGREVLPEGSPLVNILELAELHPGDSHDVFRAFLLEMGLPNRPPMLFLFDNISAISTASQIPSPKYPHKPIHPHRLWLPFFFTCLLNGTQNHPNAAVVAATSQHPKARTLDLALGDATQEPYEEIDRRIPHSIDGATIIRAGDKLTSEEAMGLSQFYKEAGLLKTIDRFDGINKTVGDQEYYYPDSRFFIEGGKDDGDTRRDPHSFKRRGKMSQGIVSDYLGRGGLANKEDPTDVEATMERLALGGYTARGFWKACTRMSHF